MKPRSAGYVRRSASYSPMTISTMTQSLKLIALTAALLSWLPFASAQNTPIPTPTKSQVQEAMKSRLPAPPDGFKWQLYKNVVFLKPTGWNEREMTQANYDTAIAREIMGETLSRISRCRLLAA